MLKMFLILKNKDIITYNYYFEGILSEDNRGSVSFLKSTNMFVIDNIAKNERNRYNAGMALARLRDLVDSGEFPKETGLSWN